MSVEKQSDVRIAMIVAMANNNVIGVKNALPWRIPEDLKYFKQHTVGKKILMGRKTFDSIGRPLPDRCNIVVTRNKNWQRQDVDIAHTVEEGLQRAVNLSLRDGNPEVMVVGGEQIYREAISSATRLYVTRVFTEVEGDAKFPEIDNGQWREIERQEIKARLPNNFDFAFTVLDRVTS